MRIFAIVDREKIYPTTSYLFYHEGTKRFITEIIDHADPYDVPFMFESVVKNGFYTVCAQYSFYFISERIVPPDRQNIVEILKKYGLTIYDEFDMLMIASGRCEQDAFELQEISFSELPDCIQERRAIKVVDVIPAEKPNLLVFFSNGITKLCNIEEIMRRNWRFNSHFKSNEMAFKNAQVEVDGCGVYWKDDLLISAKDLYSVGNTLPLGLNEIKSYIGTRIMNTAEVSEMLLFSRQYINQLIKNNKLNPVLKTKNDTLFWASDIESYKNC